MKCFPFSLKFLSYSTTKRPFVLSFSSVTLCFLTSSSILVFVQSRSNQHFENASDCPGGECSGGKTKTRSSQSTVRLSLFFFISRPFLFPCNLSPKRFTVVTGAFCHLAMSTSLRSISNAKCLLSFTPTVVPTKP